jgi:hypothetical protein
MKYFVLSIIVGVTVALPQALARPARLPYEPEPETSPPVSPEKVREADWSPYGFLHRTDLRFEPGQLVYALKKDDGTLIIYVTVEEGKTLESYIGRRIAVHGATFRFARARVPCVVASHVAVP